MIDDPQAPRCHGDRCRVAANCPLYQDRDNPIGLKTLKTQRRLWESPDIVCLNAERYLGNVVGNVVAKVVGKDEEERE